MDLFLKMTFERLPLAVRLILLVILHLILSFIVWMGFSAMLLDLIEGKTNELIAIIVVGILVVCAFVISTIKAIKNLHSRHQPSG